MFRIEVWEPGRGWWIARRDIPESERQELLDANTSEGHVYSDADPQELPEPPLTVFRFVNQ